MYENKNKNVMTCSFCTSRNDNKSSAFVTGCDSFRIENIQNKIPWKFWFSYIRFIDIKEVNTAQSRTTPVERVIQNLKSVQISERIMKESWHQLTNPFPWVWMQTRKLAISNTGSFFCFNSNVSNLNNNDVIKQMIWYSLLLRVFLFK